MKQILRLTVLLGGCLSLAFAASAQELLTNGGFESQPNFGAGAAGNGSGFSAMTGNQMPGWTVVSGHAVTVHQNGAGAWPSMTGTYSVNTDGEGFNSHNADFYQDFATVLGGAYNLSFDYQGWINDAANTLLHISVLDLATNSLIYNQSFGYNSALIHISQLLASGNGHSWRLEIQETPESGFNDNQFVIDNFSVTQRLPSGVPEAGSTIGLMLLSIGTLLSVRRWVLCGA